MDATRIAPVDAMAVHGDGASAGHIGFDAYAARTDALAWIVEDHNLNQALDSALKFANGLQIIHSTATHKQISASTIVPIISAPSSRTSAAKNRTTVSLVSGF
jgi:2-polyprenyl-6-methoxyphenol hydroxylase-like FAD-dependent oxidoreductase